MPSILAAYVEEYKSYSIQRQNEQIYPRIRLDIQQQRWNHTDRLLPTDVTLSSVNSNML